jgi:hypothetical protein
MAIAILEFLTMRAAAAGRTVSHGGGGCPCPVADRAPVDLPSSASSAEPRPGWAHPPVCRPGRVAYPLATTSRDCPVPSPARAAHRLPPTCHGMPAANLLCATKRSLNVGVKHDWTPEESPRCCAGMPQATRSPCCRARLTACSGKSPMSDAMSRPASLIAGRRPERPTSNAEAASRTGKAAFLFDPQPKTHVKWV